jgi:hypothetical protein
MAENSKIAKPWICPTHPEAQVLHTWDRKRAILNGLPQGIGVATNNKYECAICGTELSSEAFMREDKK